jgi:hypothetical protein
MHKNGAAGIRMTIDDAGYEPSNEKSRDWRLVEPMDGMTLTIGAVPGTPVDRTGSFAVTITYTGVPAGAGLDVMIIRDAGAGRYAESGGSLTLRPVPVEGTGSAQFEFNGSAVSAPTDMPGFYPIDAGRYRLVATLLNHRHRVHGWPVRGLEIVTYARIVSDSFLLTGMPNLREFAFRIRRAFETRLSEGLGLYAPGVSLDRYSIEHAPVFSAAHISIRYEMLPPFAGTFVAQVPATLASEVGVRHPRPDQIAFTGKIGFGSGIVTHRTARRAAIDTFVRLVTASGGDAAAPYTTGWIYRRDRQAWFFEAACRGGEENRGVRAIVSVTRGGAASVVEFRPFGERLSTELFYDPDPWTEPVALETERIGRPDCQPGLVGTPRDLITGSPLSAGPTVEPLPENLSEGAAIVAFGAYKGGIETRFDIAGEKKLVGSVRLSADRDGPPVVLVLSGYDPIIWDLRAVPTARLRAVVVFSASRHAVAGLDDSVMLLFACGKDRERVGAGVHAYEGGEMLDRLAAAIMALTGRTIDLFEGGYAPEAFRLKGAAGAFAEAPMADKAPLAIRADVPVTLSPVAPREAGVRQLLAEGAIRPATELDRVWLSAALTRTSATGHLARVPAPPARGKAYVVLRTITIPKGMYGAHSAEFFIPNGVPHPDDPGSHNVYYAMDDGAG